jgi:hypothetical protein
MPPGPDPQPQRPAQKELESLLKKVPGRRTIIPAIFLFLAIVVASALLYVAFAGVPNHPWVRYVLRILRI